MNRSALAALATAMVADAPHFDGPAARGQGYPRGPEAKRRAAAERAARKERLELAATEKRRRKSAKRAISLAIPVEGREP